MSFFSHRMVSERGLTVIEAIVAVTILGAALVSIALVATRSLGLAQAGRNQLIAANLAQEGIEIIRSIRDTNWIENNKTDGADCAALNWREGLCNGDWRVDYTTAATATSLLAFGANPVLNLDAATGLYSYSAGAPTIFKRKITLADEAALTGKQMRLTAEVRWLGPGGTLCQDSPQEKCLTVEDRLFNWFGNP